MLDIWLLYSYRLLKIEEYGLPTNPLEKDWPKPYDIVNRIKINKRHFFIRN